MISGLLFGGGKKGFVCLWMGRSRAWKKVSVKIDHTSGGFTEVSYHSYTPQRLKSNLSKTVLWVSPSLFSLRIQGIRAYTWVPKTKKGFMKTHETSGALQTLDWCLHYQTKVSHTNPRLENWACPGGGKGNQDHRIKQELVPAPAPASPSLEKAFASFISEDKASVLGGLYRGHGKRQWQQTCQSCQTQSNTDGSKAFNQ